MDLSVVIPVFNEANRLPRSLARIISYFRGTGIAFEVVVVDDGSTDESRVIIQGYEKRCAELKLVGYPANRGKGHAVGMGVARATGDFILLTDADLSTPIQEYDRFMRVARSGYDIVIGSRRIKGADIRIRQPFHRRILGRGFGLLTELAFLRGIKDSQCGFKLFKCDVAKNAFAYGRIDGFCFDVEILYIARKRLHARILELPVQWSDSAKHSKVHAGRETFRMLRDLFRIKLMH